MQALVWEISAIKERKVNYDRPNSAPTDRDLAPRAALWLPMQVTRSAMGNRRDPGRACTRTCASGSVVSGSHLAHTTDIGGYWPSALHVLARFKTRYAPDALSETHCRRGLLSEIFLPLILGATLAFGLCSHPSFAGPKASLLSFMLTVGTSMTITAFPVLVRLFAEKNMPGTRIGMLALTCVAVDDVVAWCLLALVVAVVHDKGVASAGVTVRLTVLFFFVMLIVEHPLRDLRVPYWVFREVGEKYRLPA